MPQKVMIFSSVHPYDDTRIFHKQAVSLAQAGYEVELHAVADFEEKFEKGVKIVGVKRHAKKWKRLENGRILYERALKSHADIFHFHDPELLPWGVRLAKKTNKPVIYDAHEDLPKQIYTKMWIPGYLRGSLSRLVHWIEKRWARKLAAVITATEPIANQFQTAKQVTVIKNYPLAMPKVDRDENEKNIILYIGGISYLRGYREMIQMMDYIPRELNAELHLVGPLQHIAPADCDEKELLKKNVYLHGRVPFEEVKHWLAKGKVGLVCLHPTQNYPESLPIKMFEYMAAGLPLVASNFPQWKEIVETSQSGFTVDPLNPEEMADKVTRLLSDSSLRKKMGQNGRKAHEEVYNWQVEENKLLELYRILLSK
ncbi:glycosyltransferase family 4 protein [Thermoflavimicrobium dichotomicum]|uniref:Glycosyltransferase involved in cell wall bisynthesis n=1 Tax=Thermoflavimicrobium dichotomicum TaxID=46223 RepID=A0A1I3K026_9BACL|nr:glycosyltransferase family 4 protein [Thermoflavimicrobium dichotomicum]SFI65545.1 Glycosyltransferase involved in cell wall bisynthesis [Thermoflavimicrobium dichotomicum]